MKVNVGGTLKTVVSAKINVGGTLKQVTKVRHNVGGTIKAGALFTLPLSATASDYNPTGWRSGTGNVTTSAVTITSTGGYAPYTYAWSRTAGNGSAGNATSASTTFSDYVIAGWAGNDTIGTFQCVVTDAHSQTVTVSGIEATFFAF